MWAYVVPAAAAVVVAIIEAIAAKERRATKADREWREKESRLSMQMMHATLQLSIVTSNAVTGGHNNGNVERSRTAAEDAEKAYQDFLMEAAAHEVTK